MQLAGSTRRGAAGTDRSPWRAEATTRGRVLVVDDDEATRRGLEKLLRADGFAVSTAADGAAALASAERSLPDVVLTDLQMLPLDGIELCKRLHEIDEGLPVIVMTGRSDVDSIVESLRERAEDYLLKPLNYNAVVWCVERALARRNAKRKQEEIQRALNESLVLNSLREREHAEAEARQRAQLKALLENLSDGVIIADQNGRVALINRSARAILGLDNEHSADALDAVEVHDLQDRLLPRTECPRMRALRGEQFTDYETLYLRPNGERRRVISTGTSVRDENGEIALAIVILRDVTELRQLEQQRSEYLALISHDLRNPLSVVLMSLANLKKGLTREPVPPPLALDLAERAERNAQRMNVMLNELREVTSLESHGGDALELVPCELGALIANVVDTLDDARARRVQIETDGVLGHVVLADVPRLERVVANLLTNALKYSAEDATVIVRHTSAESWVELAVVDRGIGIPAASVERLFEKYYRTPNGKSHASGLGLGLYIAQLIAGLHGGRIEVSSEVGTGSTFTLLLPAHTGSA